MELGQSLQADFYMVLEDDAVTADPDIVSEILFAAMPAMSRKWCLLQLGSKTCGAAPHSRRRKVVALEHNYHLHTAERNILAHAYVVHKNRGGPLLLQYLRDGKTPDNALQALQNFFLRKNITACYTIQPSLLEQDQHHSSATCKLSSWDLALKTKPASQPMLTNTDRGTRRINKRKMSDLRANAGAKGGKAKAGSGVTAAEMRAKKRRLLTYAAKHGFPTRNKATVAFGISKKTWANFRREWNAS